MILGVPELASRDDGHRTHGPRTPGRAGARPGEDGQQTEEDMDMTDTLQLVRPAEPADAAAEDPGCGCCVRPPAAAAEKMAVLEARRETVERRLRSLRAAQG